MKRFVSSTFVLFFIVSLFSVDIAHSLENSVTLRSDTSTVTLNRNEPTFIQIYPSDLQGMNDPYGNTYLLLNGNRGSTDSFQEGYKAKIEKTDSNAGIYTISISPSDPIKNGNYVLSIQEQRLRSNPVGESQKLTINIIVNIDAATENLFDAKFDFSCPVVYYGEKLKCTVTPNLSGAGRNIATGLYSVQYQLKTSGAQKWRTYKKSNWSINNSVVSTFIDLSKPTSLKVNINYQGADYSFSAKVKPKIKIDFYSPGAAIVGENFYLEARTNKNYSANCVVNNYSLQFKIAKGYGKILIYGQTPGNLNLYIGCKSSEWADSGGYKFVYIRP